MIVGILSVKDAEVIHIMTIGISQLYSCVQFGLFKANFIISSVMSSIGIDASLLVIRCRSKMAYNVEYNRSKAHSTTTDKITNAACALLSVIHCWQQLILRKWIN